MTNWMKELAYHYEQMRDTYPQDELLIVFDIDNTIIDMREMIAHVLKGYDRRHRTGYFADLAPDALSINENQVDAFLGTLALDDETRAGILDWYLEQRWNSEAILTSHRPFAGVMEVIRWFQMQPRTHVGLNTGRVEAYREDTLRSLNALGAEFKVTFSDDLLWMYAGDGAGEVTDSKVSGMRRFQERGYRIFAYVDNEPDNLEAVLSIDETGEILPVHADTIFDSKRSRLPLSTVSGREYDLTELIAEKDLPAHITFVWHGVNDRVNLRQFIASDVQWGECDVRHDEGGKRVILRHDNIKRRPRAADEELLAFEDIVDQVLQAGKSLKIDIKEAGPLVGDVIRILKAQGVAGRDLWFNGVVDELGVEVFEQLSLHFPQAIVQCPVGFMAPLVLISPSLARQKLESYRSWGINRLSIAWGTNNLGTIMDRLDAWGFDVNIYNAPDLEAFLKAVLLQPASITSDFNFPKWHYFGVGAGENSRHHRYVLGDGVKQR